MTDNWLQFLEAVRSGPPAVALVLGSGMAPVVDRISDVAAVEFGDAPGLVPPTVHGHGGRILLGDWAGRRVLVFSGRLHFYEGHPWERVVRPVEIAAELGARGLVLTNAAGGIRKSLRPGSLVVLTDHLECNRPAWWRLPGPGDRPCPYSLGWIERFIAAGLESGVYAAVTGPSYETPAEVRALRSLGADLVGMSTAREAARAAELGLEVAAVSCVTNPAAGLSAGPLHHGEVLKEVAAAADRLGDVLGRVLPLLG